MPAASANSLNNVYVHLLHGQDAALCATAFAAGKAPESTPYGFGRAISYGFSLAFSHDRSNRIGLAAAKIMRKIAGFDVVHALANLRRIRRCDVIWTMTEGEAFAVALIFALGLCRPRPIVANAVWLFDRWDSLGPMRRALYRFLARYISVLTVHSRPSLEPARIYFPRVQMDLTRFGINHDVFSFAPRDFQDRYPICIFAAGNDRTRDWTIMLHAFGQDARFHVKLACRWLKDADVAPFPNIELVNAMSIADYKAMHEWADYTVIPMHENIFSGITVALEAAAMGVPIISTRTGGVSTYFGEDDVFYCPVGDAAALREIAANTTAKERHIRATNARRTFLEQDYSTDALVRQYIALTQQLAHRPGKVPDALPSALA